MIEIIDLTSGDDKSPQILLHQCEHIRRLLLMRVHDSFNEITNDVSPIIAAGARLLSQAAEQNWNSKHIDLALHEVTALEAVCRRVERLIRCYHELLAAAPMLAASRGTNEDLAGNSDTFPDQN